jgi:hypothetical protein
VLQVMVMRVRVGARTFRSGLDSYALQPVSAIHGPELDKEDGGRCSQCDLAALPCSSSLS